MMTRFLLGGVLALGLLTAAAPRVAADSLRLGDEAYTRTSLQMEISKGAEIAQVGRIATFHGGDVGSERYLHSDPILAPPVVFPIGPPRGTLGPVGGTLPVGEPGVLAMLLMGLAGVMIWGSRDNRTPKES
jgi:hypothetical protein